MIIKPIRVDLDSHYVVEEIPEMMYAAQKKIFDILFSAMEGKDVHFTMTRGPSISLSYVGLDVNLTMEYGYPISCNFRSRTTVWENGISGRSIEEEISFRQSMNETVYTVAKISLPISFRVIKDPVRIMLIENCVADWTEEKLLRLLAGQKE